MTRARKTPPRRGPNPLAATIAPVDTDPPAPPSDPKPTPTFLPNPAAAWRSLRTHWIAQRGELPAQSLPNATFPATTVADVVEIANHITAALRNDVGRVDSATGRRIWDRWRESVATVRKQVARVRDANALYKDNETFWEDSILHIVWFLPGRPRNASTDSDVSAVRNVGKRIVSGRPRILAVDIKWSDDDALPTGRFPTLAAADDALAAYFTTTPPKFAHYRITYYVTFTDGAAHQGRIELPAASISDWIQRGGILRHHLLTEGSKQRKEDGNLGRTLRTDAAIDAVALGGIELQRRIRADTKVQASASRRPKAVKRKAAEEPVAELHSTERASSWVSVMPSPPRLLPSPQDRFFELYRALQGAFDGGRVDWADPRVNAFVNYITRALRAEIPQLDAGDATILWWRWREAVQGFQRHRTDENHGDIYFRALTIARQVGHSARDPGSVFQSFCPWRSLYFDLGSDPATQRVGRSRMEVDPWAA